MKNIIGSVYAWLFRKRSISFLGITLFMNGDAHILSCRQCSGHHHNVNAEVRGAFGNVLYDKTFPRSNCMIENVEIVPRRGTGFSFTIVNNDLSVVRHDRAEPLYLYELTARERKELEEFMLVVREKVTEATAKVLTLG